MRCIVVVFVVVVFGVFVAVHCLHCFVVVVVVVYVLVFIVVAFSQYNHQWHLNLFLPHHVAIGTSALCGYP